MWLWTYVASVVTATDLLKEKSQEFGKKDISKGTYYGCWGTGSLVVWLLCYEIT